MLLADGVEFEDRFPFWWVSPYGAAPWKVSRGDDFASRGEVVAYWKYKDAAIKVLAANRTTTLDASRCFHARDAAFERWRTERAISSVLDLYAAAG